MTPAQLCDLAQQHGAKTLVSTYNEPLITSEWAVEVFHEAKERGFLTGFVSNGHATPEALNFNKDLLTGDVHSGAEALSTRNIEIH